MASSCQRGSVRGNGDNVSDVCASGVLSVFVCVVSSRFCVGGVCVFIVMFDPSGASVSVCVVSVQVIMCVLCGVRVCGYSCCGVWYECR